MTRVQAKGTALHPTADLERLQPVALLMALQHHAPRPNTPGLDFFSRSRGNIASLGRLWVTVKNI